MGRLRKLEDKDAPFMLEWMHDKEVTAYLERDFAGMELADCRAFIRQAAAVLEAEEAGAAGGDGTPAGAGAPGGTGAGAPGGTESGAAGGDEIPAGLVAPGGDGTPAGAGAPVDGRHFAVAADDGEYLGTISLKNIDRQNRRAEYAVSCRKKTFGTGCAAEATRDLFDVAAQVYGLETLYLYVREENIRAWKMYEKCGFVRVERPEYVKGEFPDGLRWYEKKLAPAGSRCGSPDN